MLSERVDGLTPGRLRRGPGASPLSTTRWTPAILVLVGVEVLLLLFLRFEVLSASPFELRAYLGVSELLLGRPGVHPGVVKPLLVTNLLAVLALWVTERSSRPRLGSGTARATCLGAALLLAAISYAACQLATEVVPLEVEEVIGGAGAAAGRSSFRIPF